MDKIFAAAGGIGATKVHNAVCLLKQRIRLMDVHAASTAAPGRNSVARSGMSSLRQRPGAHITAGQAQLPAEKSAQAHVKSATRIARKLTFTTTGGVQYMSLGAKEPLTA